jgi:hypothetical protein
MSKPIFKHPATGAIVEIPVEIISGDRKFTYVAPKTAGWSTGGWYEDSKGKRYLAKFSPPQNPAFSYMEGLLNDLARVSVVDNEFVEVVVGRGEGQGTCVLTAEIPNYRDLINIKAESKVEADSIKLRKPFAPGLHRFFAFSALIGNDDLNEENLGVAQDGTTLVIDLGLTPTFLYPEQIEFAAVPFHLTSFVSHRNLNGMQLVRRRYFGLEEFTNPHDKSKPRFRPEDLSYLDILDGVKNIIDNRDKIAAVIAANLEAVAQDQNLDATSRDAYLAKFSRFGEIIKQRIDWMAENFAEDLTKISTSDGREKFAAEESIKWRLHPKYQELMEAEAAAFKTCAERDLDANLAELGKLLPCQSRAEILKLDLRTVEKSYLQACVKDKFMLHNALIVGDFEMAAWLVENDICDLNLDRKLRNHNYQLFRTTPLHAAIAIYHDKLFDGKEEELKPLAQIIDLMKAKFIEKNGPEFDAKKRDYAAEGANGFALQMTFGALKKYTQLASEKAIAAATIQRKFRAHQTEKLSSAQQEVDGVTA